MKRLKQVTPNLLIMAALVYAATIDWKIAAAFIVALVIGEVLEGR